MRRPYLSASKRSRWPVLLLACGLSCSPELHPATAPICDAEQDCHCALSTWRVCGDRCVNPQSDPQHCGSCAVSCGEQVCLNGACADDCGPLEQCGETCRLPDDPFNCGACGVQCQKSCANHICEEHVACGLLTSCQGRCVDIRTDTKNCGRCGNDCLGLPYCNNGTCERCPHGLTLCYGACVDLERDRHNCGRCGNWCPNDSYSHEYCDDGWCSDCPIKENMRVCDGQCVSLATDFNCGDCGVQCSEDTHCHNGWCQSY